MIFWEYTGCIRILLTMKKYFFRRGLNPPHRVKSINMSTFTQDEVEFMKSHGNQVGFYDWNFWVEEIILVK